MSNINNIIYNIFYEDEEDDSWERKKRLGLALGGALLAGGLASQTHTGKAVTNYVKSKMTSNPFKKVGHLAQAAWHGNQSPFLKNTVRKEAGKALLKTGIAAGTVYGAKKAYDYSQTPEGLAKWNNLKQSTSDLYNSAKEKVTNFFNNNKSTN